MKSLQRIIKVVLVLNVVFFGLFDGVALCQNVGINETNPDNSALLEMTSTEMGLLVPRMTAVERDAIVDPANGLIIFNLSDTCLNFYRVSEWHNMCDCAENNAVEPPSTCGEETITFVYNGNSVTYGVVEGQNGRCWLDRNLGALQQGTAYNDHLAYGDLFQWGRLSDGHQVLNWVSSTATDGAEQANVTTTTSSTDVPGHSNFITNEEFDWRFPENENLWQGANGTNNPCPSGFRLPTSAEFEAEQSAWATNNISGAHASSLKIVTAGMRGHVNAHLWGLGRMRIYGVVLYF